MKKSRINLIIPYDLAKEHGIEEAMVLEYFIYEIDQKALNGINFKKGRNWTYNTNEALLSRLPFNSRKSLMRVINSLVNKDLLVLGNFNKLKYDKTIWYSLTDKCAKDFEVLFQSKESILEKQKLEKEEKDGSKAMSETGHGSENEGQNKNSHGCHGPSECPKPAIRMSQTGQPIPSSLTSSSPSLKSSSEYCEEAKTTTTLSKDIIRRIAKKFKVSVEDASKGYEYYCLSNPDKPTPFKILLSKVFPVSEFSDLLNNADNYKAKAEAENIEAQYAENRRKAREEKDRIELEEFNRLNAHKYKKLEVEA